MLLYLPTLIQWGLRPDGPSSSVAVSLDFFPFDWATSDDVQLNFGWQRVGVTDADLKEDPPAATELILPKHGTTGQVIPVAALRKHDIQMALFPLAQEDVESRRQDRWRLRPGLVESLPPGLAPLASGPQNGSSPQP